MNHKLHVTRTYMYIYMYILYYTYTALQVTYQFHVHWSVSARGLWGRGLKGILETWDGLYPHGDGRNSDTSHWVDTGTDNEHIRRLIWLHTGRRVGLRSPSTLPEALIGKSELQIH